MNTTQKCSNLFPPKNKKTRPQFIQTIVTSLTSLPPALLMPTKHAIIREFSSQFKTSAKDLISDLSRLHWFPCSKVSEQKNLFTFTTGLNTKYPILPYLMPCDLTEAIREFALISHILST